MTDSIKPGPCPACGSDQNDHYVTDWRQAPGKEVHWISCRGRELLCCSGPKMRSAAEAIAAWNSIRARVLREAAEIAGGEYWTRGERDPVKLLSAIQRAADRAERGEA